MPHKLFKYQINRHKITSSQPNTIVRNASYFYHIDQDTVLNARDVSRDMIIIVSGLAIVWVAKTTNISISSYSFKHYITVLLNKQSVENLTSHLNIGFLFLYIFYGFYL